VIAQTAVDQRPASWHAVASPTAAYHYDVAAACRGSARSRQMNALSLRAGYLRFAQRWRRAIVLRCGFPLVYTANVGLDLRHCLRREKRVGRPVAIARTTCWAIGSSPSCSAACSRAWRRYSAAGAGVDFGFLVAEGDLENGNRSRISGKSGGEIAALGATRWTRKIRTRTLEHPKISRRSGDRGVVIGLVVAEMFFLHHCKPCHRCGGAGRGVLLAVDGKD